ncbi:uncharacterized protein LAJ45_03764 [Morchella importuna]|uniref:uncharacterized protein n=1 Tax=Morchella importuna TaxID=1174673 RepID=UPI001E8D0206|nr:uncharacterized protein LAJ45_03764 [Morchella importuna]KAH8152337.1 hypothetical protein LAJ45_03764 [Morchella importuna]
MILTPLCFRLLPRDSPTDRKPVTLSDPFLLFHPISLDPYSVAQSVKVNTPTHHLRSTAISPFLTLQDP